MDNYCLFTTPQTNALQAQDTGVGPVPLEIYNVSTTTVEFTPIYTAPCNTVFDSSTLWLLQFFMLFFIFYVCFKLIMDLGKKTL